MLTQTTAETIPACFPCMTIGGNVTMVVKSVVTVVVTTVNVTVVSAVVLMVTTVGSTSVELVATVVVVSSVDTQGGNLH